jgi:hypothetical protein
MVKSVSDSMAPWTRGTGVGVLESLLKLLYGVDSLVMMVNKKTKFPAQALLAIATFLKTFHHALDNMDANMRDLPVVRPAKGTSTMHSASASATSPQGSAPSPVVLPNRQVFLARVLRRRWCMAQGLPSPSPWPLVHCACRQASPASSRAPLLLPTAHFHLLALPLACVAFEGHVVGW